MIRQGVSELLRARRVRVSMDCQTEADLLAETSQEANPNSAPCDLIVLILSEGHFSTISRVHKAIAAMGSDIPLVVLSERIGRGQVYAALRIGAKAYLSLDCRPDELAEAIRTAAVGKVYLSPEVAEVLVNDVSASAQPARSQWPAGVKLSSRETQIVQLLCEGLSSKEIARELHLSAKTVENHRYNIYRKCEVDNLPALMRHAIRQGMITI
jgi:DNA-binding NarL/FixJ family response regulator